MPSAEQQRHTRVPSDISWSTGFHLIAPIPCRQASCVLPKITPREIAPRETAPRAHSGWSRLTRSKAATQAQADPLRACGISLQEVGHRGKNAIETLEIATAQSCSTCPASARAPAIPSGWRASCRSQAPPTLALGTTSAASPTCLDVPGHACGQGSSARGHRPTQCSIRHKETCCFRCINPANMGAMEVIDRRGPPASRTATCPQRKNARLIVLFV